MIPVNRRTKIFVYKEFVDMRSSYDSLCFKVQNVLKQDPFSGHMFLFMNKKRNAIKCLCYDGTGLILLCKRLEKGTFFKINPFHKKDIIMTQAEFSLYIDGGDINRRFLDSPREIKKK